MGWSRRGLRLALGVALSLCAQGAAAQVERPSPINVDVIVAQTRRRPDPPPREAGPAPAAESSGLTNSFAAPPSRVREVEDRIQQTESELDERVSGIEAQLRGRAVYDEIHFLERHRMVLAPDEDGILRLPTGHAFRAHLDKVDERGAVMVVEVEDRLRTGVNVASGRPLVLIVAPYQDGDLVISVEAYY